MKTSDFRPVAESSPMLVLFRPFGRVITMSTMIYVKQLQGMHSTVSESHLTSTSDSVHSPLCKGDLAGYIAIVSQVI